MPAPSGAPAFIINPVIDDLMDFTPFASGTPGTADRPGHGHGSETGNIRAHRPRRLSALKYSTAGQKFFNNLTKEQFYMFRTAPVAYESMNKPSTRKSAIPGPGPACPSEMTFDVPPDATESPAGSASWKAPTPMAGGPMARNS